MACLSVKASWRRLPVELWDKIFVFYLEEIRTRVGQDQSKRKVPSKPLSLHDYAIRSMDPMDTSRFPVKVDSDALYLTGMNAPYSLLSVCQAWRAAVMSARSIWSDITIPTFAKKTAIGTIPFMAPANANRLVARLKRIVANPMAWSLTIIERQAPQLSKSRPSVDDADELSLSSILVQAGAPLGSSERLKIIVHPSMSAAYLGQFDLHSTSSLVVMCQKDQARFDHLPQMANLKKAVLINAIELDKDQIPSNFPWSQLTHLLIQGRLPNGRINDLIALCTSLRRSSFLAEHTRFVAQGRDRVLAEQAPTSSALEVLDIFGTERQSWHLDFPLIDFSFPALTKLRISGPYRDPNQLARYLQPFHALTHLSLVVFAGGGYSVGAVLDSCPFLVELVASLQGKLDPPLQESVFCPDKPRGCHLRVLALLYDFGAQFDGFMPQVTNPNADIRAAVITIINLVASWRQSPSTVSSPPPLERFILRFTDHPALARIRLDKPALVSSIGMAVGTALQPLVDNGLQLSVESLDERLTDFYPSPCGRHWDEEIVLNECWEFTASMPPLSGP